MKKIKACSISLLAAVLLATCSVQVFWGQTESNSHIDSSSSQEGDNPAWNSSLSPKPPEESSSSSVEPNPDPNPSSDISSEEGGSSTSSTSSTSSASSASSTHSSSNSGGNNKPDSSSSSTFTQVTLKSVKILDPVTGIDYGSNFGISHSKKTVTGTLPSSVSTIKVTAVYSDGRTKASSTEWGVLGGTTITLPVPDSSGRYLSYRLIISQNASATSQTSSEEDSSSEESSSEESEISSLVSSENTSSTVNKEADNGSWMLWVGILLLVLGVGGVGFVIFDIVRGRRNGGSGNPPTNGGTADEDDLEDEEYQDDYEEDEEEDFEEFDEEEDIPGEDEFEILDSEKEEDITDFMSSDEKAGKDKNS